MHRGDLIPTYSQLTWNIIVSLPANLSTTMLLVDYAAHGMAIPTSWPATVPAALSAKALKNLEEMRAILAHGSVLRAFFLQYLPHDAQPQYDWQALHDWIAQLTETEIKQLSIDGIRSNLAYYQDRVMPVETEQWLEKLGTASPDASLLTDPTKLRLAVRAVLAGWEVQSYEPALALIEHPGALRTTILSFLEELWQKGFRAEWELRKDALKQTVASVQTWLMREASTHVPEDIIFRVTGLQPAEEQMVHAVRRATNVVFVPCLFLGRFLSYVPVHETLYLFYEPATTPEGRSEILEDQQARPQAFQVMDLEALGPAMKTLGDTTSLTILLLLAEHGELFAQQVAEKLNVHQSTISRHFAQLERTDLVSVRRSKGMRYYSVNRQHIQEVCHLLLKTFA